MPLTPERYTALLRSCEPSVVDLPVDKQQVLSCEGFLRAQCHLFNQVCCYEEGLFQDLQTIGCEYLICDYSNKQHRPCITIVVYSSTKLFPLSGKATSLEGQLLK